MIFTEQSLKSLQQVVNVQEVLCHFLPPSTKCHYCSTDKYFSFNKEMTHACCDHCGFNGDSVVLLMSLLKLSFSQAVQKLALHYKIDMSQKYVQKQD